MDMSMNKAANKSMSKAANKSMSMSMSMSTSTSTSMDVGVLFRDLSVVGENTSATTLPDMASTFFLVKNGFDFSTLPSYRYVIKDVTGFCDPGSLTLVLGRPGSGCSTLLKTVSGESKTYIETRGNLSFNGVSSKEFFKYFKNLLVYNPELDVHFPFLTVDETLQFAENSKSKTSKNRDHYETILGLDHIKDTYVGNDFVRGVSGGERKRVSIAEALLLNGRVLAFDNVTRGLDSSTALEFIESLKEITTKTNCTSIVTIYQASEKIYQLFDYVTVLYLGRQIYFGKIENAVDYFESIGFSKHERQTSCEFLTSITDDNGKYSPDELEDIWKRSSQYAQLIDLINSRTYDSDDSFNQLCQYRDSNKEKLTFKNSYYSLNFFSQLKNCCKRRTQSIINNKAYTITFISASVIQSLIIGSLAYNTPYSTIGAFSRGGIIFFACLYFSIMTLAETPALFEDKPILNKQYAYTMYHPAVELISKQLVQIPIRLIAIILFTLIMYFLSNMKYEPGPFFQFLLIVNLVVQAVSSLFILFSSLMPNLSSAMAINGIVMLFLSIYSSYMIQLRNMYWWFKWISYINPILYAFEAMITMQFHHLRMPCYEYNLIPFGPFYTNIDPTINQVCGFVGSVESKILYNGSNDINGDIYLSDAFEYTFGHTWRNFGILVAFIFGFVAINSFIVEVYNPIPKESDKLLFVNGCQISDDLVAKFMKIGDVQNVKVKWWKRVFTARFWNFIYIGNYFNRSKRHRHHFIQRVNRLKSINEKSSNINNTSNNSNNELNSDGVIDDSKISSSSGTTPPTIEPTKSNFEKLGSNDIFVWKNLNYTVPYNDSERKLLDSIQGFVLPGTMTALIGESGAGKTTLLNVLSKRTDVGVITGDLLVNGKDVDLSFQRRTGYVQQQDLHVAELTVKESLLFAARLRRPKSVPDEEKVAYVEKILNILKMKDYENSIAGKPGYGLNVEQRKKLSIATELVAKPSLLLFLDEPTSGLDSQSSWAIVQVLKDLANAGQAILCTIHQPSAMLFESFDKLLLLKRGGKTVYFGDIGLHSSIMLQYFEKNGCRKCLKDENPAEYMLDVIGAGSTANHDIDWNERWVNSEEFSKVTAKIDELIEISSKAESNNSTGDEDLELTKTYATPYMYQFYQVNKRTFLQLWRSIPYVLPKFGLNILSGLITGFSFWNAKNDVVGMQNVMFANFLTLVVSAPIMNQIQTFAINSRELFEVRESKSNTFHWSCLLIAQYLNELPYCIILSTLYFVGWYFPVQLDTSPSRCGLWWFTYCFFYQLYYPSLALAILYPAPDLPSANVIMGLIFSFTMAFCGVFQIPQLMPGFWKFMWRVSPLTYFVGNLLSISLHDRPVECAELEYNYLQPTENLTCGEYLTPYFEYMPGYVANPESKENCAVCKYSIGDDYLESIGISWDNRWRNIGFFCVYIGVNFFGMIGLYYIFRVKRLISLDWLQVFVSKMKNVKGWFKKSG